jgi:23S rRNA pseudouridine2605 synthase
MHEMRPVQRSGHPPSGPLSLARALSKFGVCSRKQAELWIAAGRVEVDGRVALWPQRRIDPRRQSVRVDGEPVGDRVERIVVMLNKPCGYLTSRVDPRGRPTVYDLTRDLQRWVFPVGRLDRDSAGLLLLTNDHGLGQRLTDPHEHVPKTYHVRVSGVPGPEALRALREGVVLDRGESTRPARVRCLGTARQGTWLEIVLTEGKNRQLRRMWAAVGHQVEELTRVKVGGLGLGDLASGSWRRLAESEVRALDASRRG